MTTPLARPRPFALLFALVVPVLMIASGCEDDKPKKKLQTRETIGKKTQDVRNLKAEVAKGGKTTDGKIPESDYLTTTTSSYRVVVGNLAIMTVKHNMDIYETANDTKIKTYEEFMENIIKKGQPDGMQLPMLPYYQEYGYDADKRELVVIEYPAKKKAMEEQTDREMGRK